MATQASTEVEPGQPRHFLTYPKGFRSLPDAAKHEAQFYQPPTASDELRLKKTVFLGYTDTAVAGSRALLGLNMRKEYEVLDVPQLHNLEPVCHRPNPLVPTEQTFQPLQVLHCKYEEFSLVVINCILPAEKCHFVADKVIDLCLNSNVEKLVVLSTQRMDDSESDLLPIYENCFNTGRVTQNPPLPLDTKICDPFLSTLIQIIQIEDIPCNIFTAPAHKASSGPANQYDGSKKAICVFHDILKNWSRLQFDKELSLSMRYRETSVDTEMAHMMYG